MTALSDVIQLVSEPVLHITRRCEASERVTRLSGYYERQNGKQWSDERHNAYEEATSPAGGAGGGGGAIGRIFVYAGGSSIVSGSCSSALGPASSCCTMLTGRKLGGAGDLRMYVEVDTDWSGVDERRDWVCSAVRAE